MSEQKDIKFCVWSSGRITRIHKIITRSCSVYPAEGCCLKTAMCLFFFCFLTFYGITWTESQKSFLYLANPFCHKSFMGTFSILWAAQQKNSQGHLGIGKICMQGVSSVVKTCKISRPKQCPPHCQPLRHFLPDLACEIFRSWLQISMKRDSAG